MLYIFSEHAVYETWVLAHSVDIPNQKLST